MEALKREWDRGVAILRRLAANLPSFSEIQTFISNNGFSSLSRLSINLPKFPPVNSNTLTRTYIPASGLIAHSLLSINVMHPSVFTRMFPRHDLTNALLLTSFMGTSTWLWRRPHIAGTSANRRFPWVFLGGTTYVLGSVLMWAIIRSTVGRHPTVCITIGLTTGGVFTYTAIDYFKYLDKDFEPLEDVTDGTHNSDEDKYDMDL